MIVLTTLCPFQPYLLKRSRKWKCLITLIIVTAFCVMLCIVLWLKYNCVEPGIFFKKPVNGINSSRFISPELTHLFPTINQWDLNQRYITMYNLHVIVANKYCSADVCWYIKPNKACQPCLLSCPIFHSPWLRQVYQVLYELSTVAGSSVCSLNSCWSQPFPKIPLLLTCFNLSTLMCKQVKG